MRDNRKSAMALVSFFTRSTSATRFGHSPATAGDVKELSWICPTGNAHISTTSNHRHTPVALLRQEPPSLFPMTVRFLELRISHESACPVVSVVHVCVWVWSIGCERQCFSDAEDPWRRRSLLLLSRPRCNEVRSRQSLLDFKQSITIKDYAIRL